MGRNAERVYTDPSDIARIEALTAELPSNAQVTIVCKDGAVHTGTVAERPIAQLYLDGEGKEGFNAVVCLEDEGVDAGRTLWLDGIAEVRKLDSISGKREA